MSMARLLAIGMIALSTTGHGAWAQTPGNAAQPPRQQAPDAASRLDALTRQLERVSQENHALRTELAKRGMVVEFEQPGIGPVRQIGSPIKMSRTPAAEPSAAPAIGGDTREVLSAAGFTAEEIEGLFESGAAAGPGVAGETEFRA